MRWMLCLISLLAFFRPGPIGLSEQAGERPRKSRIPALDAVLLGEAEVPGFSLVKHNASDWWKAARVEEDVLGPVGAEQEFRDGQVRLLSVRYARFRRAEAREAAEYYARNACVPFRGGLWKGWERRAIPDACWVPVSSTGTSLMVQKGSLCFLIDCSFEDAEEARRLTFWVAKQIAEREVRGGFKKFRLPELDAVLLSDTEVPGFTLANQNMSRWWKGKGENGEALHQLGVGQEFRDRQLRPLWVKYARFADPSQAREAAEYYTKSMAAVFRKGLWKGWEKMSIGDACWVVVGSSGAALLVQKDTLCLLIGCHIHDAEEAQGLAFSLAKKILEKEGRRPQQEATSEAHPAPVKKFRLPELDRVLLGDTEVPGFRLVNQNVFYWWRGQGEGRKGLYQLGVQQEFRDEHDRLVLVGYARFPDPSRAREAAEFYSKSMAAVFRKGLWKGWERLTIGDACWVVVRSPETALLVQKDTLCLLISCHIEDADEARRLAFSLAEKLVAKETRPIEAEGASEAAAERVKNPRIPELDPVLLVDMEVPGFALVKQNGFKWWKGTRENGQAVYRWGVFQEFRDPHKGVVFVRYARFPDAAQAREACEYYPKHVSAAFHKGLWRHLEQTTLGDACWVSSSIRAGLMVQKGSLCLLISCHVEGAEQARGLAFSLAKRILQKEEHGDKKEKPGESPAAPESPEEQTSDRSLP